MNNRVTIWALCLLMGALMALSSGCVTPRKTLFKQEYLGDRSIRHIQNPNTGEYLLEICQYDAGGKSHQCTESPILVEKETRNL